MESASITTIGLLTNFPEKRNTLRCFCPSLLLIHRLDATFWYPIWLYVVPKHKYDKTSSMPNARLPVVLVYRFESIHNSQNALSMLNSLPTNCYLSSSKLVSMSLCVSMCVCVIDLIPLHSSLLDTHVLNGFLRFSVDFVIFLPPVVDTTAISPANRLTACCCYCFWYLLYSSAFS